jgi:hypothetical protein
MIFDDIPRNFKGTRRHTEPLFDYLNRSARPSMERIRNILEEWFSRYPLVGRNELRTRFCSSDDIAHQSAFFELYVHEFLSILGYRVEVHPDVPARHTHPEFLIAQGENPIFYLEATLASGPQDEKTADKRENIVYETIDNMNSPNFFIGVKVHGSPSTPPPGRKWRGFLEKWLSELDPDAIGEKLKSDGLEGLPSITLNHDGWNVTFQAIPKSPKARGKQGVRPIGIRFFGFQECKEDEWIRKAIKEKATKYGNLDLPYLIAINVLSIFSNDDHMIMDALFGKEGVTLYRLPSGGSDQKLTRAPNGAFRGPHGPQNTRVSGVIICNELLWGNITKINPVLWHNPWASFPFSQDSWAFPQYVPDPDKNRLEPKSGRKAADLFGLPEGWPMQDGKKDFE